MVKKPHVFVIILNFNTCDMTVSQLKDIEKLDTSRVRTTCIVVDNDSSDDSLRVLKDFKLKNMEYHFIESGENLGFAGGNNLGIKYALKNNPDYILVINNDLILEKNLLYDMFSFMENNKNVGICSPKIYFAKGYEFHKDRYEEKDLGKVVWYAGASIDRNNVYTKHRGVDEVDHGQFEEAVETDVASGACMMIRPSVFNEAGLLDESLFLYWEDADFSERVRLSGFNVVCYPKVHVWHKVSASTGGSGGATNDYFLTRNRFYFSMRYSSLRTRVSVFRDTLRMALFGREWQKKGAIDALLGRKGMGQWKYRV